MMHTIRRLGPYASPYRRALAVGGVLTLAEVGLSLAQPWPLRWVVDRVLQPENPATHPQLILAVSALTLVALVLLAGVADYWATRLLAAAGLHVANDLRLSVLARLQRQSLRFHGKHRVGDLTARVTSDVAYTQEMLVQVLATLLPATVLVIGMFVVMVIIDPVFTALALLSTPPLIWATRRARKELRSAARRVRKADGALASAATEDLSAIHLVQVFGLEHERLRHFAGLSETSLTAGVDAVRVQSRFGPLVEVAGVVSTAVVLWFGAERVLSGHLSLGVLLVFITYLGSLYKPVKQLTKLSQVVSKGSAALERIGEVMEAPIDIVDAPGAVAIPIRGQVEFRNVSFSYGREPVLRDLSLTIEAGQNVALVGPTGAGKSTIAALIPRLADVTAGQVLVDGIDVRRHQLAALRGQIATVLQDTVLLDGTLRENLICGYPRARDRDVRRAARLALVDEFASPAAGRAGHAHRRARREPVRRSAAAGRDRPGDPAGCVDHHPGRAHVRAGRRLRGAARRRAGEPAAGTDEDRHRAPAVDRARRRPHLRARARPDRGGGHAQPARLVRRSVREVDPVPVRRPAAGDVSRLSHSPPPTPRPGANPPLRGAAAFTGPQKELRPGANPRPGRGGVHRATEGTSPRSDDPRPGARRRSPGHRRDPAHPGGG